MLEVFALNVALGMGGALASKGGPLLGKQIATSEVGLSVQSGITSIQSGLNTVKTTVIKKFGSKVSSAADDFSVVGQKIPDTSGPSYVSEFVQASAIKGTANTLIKMQDTTSGVYSDGKMYVVRGGLRVTDDGDSREEPIRLELLGENRKLMLQECESKKHVYCIFEHMG